MQLSLHEAEFDIIGPFQRAARLPHSIKLIDTAGMATDFFSLPAELRTKVYKYIFCDMELFWR